MIQYLADACSNQSFLPDIFDGMHNVNYGIGDLKTGAGDPCGIHITSFNDITTLLLNVVAAALELAGLVAAILVIVGAFIYVTSSGEPAGIKRGKDTVVNSLLGLGIILVALGAVKFIAGKF